MAGFLPTAYPDPVAFTRCIATGFQAGMDIAEISLPNPPFPQDGALIQRACAVGRNHVSDAAAAVRLMSGARTEAHQPIITMAGRHTFDTLGLAGLLDECVAHDVDAVMFPEHSPAEQRALIGPVRAAGLEQVTFLAHSTDCEVLAGDDVENPVVYLRSADLKTGDRFRTNETVERLAWLRTLLGGKDAYVFVGFGIRGPREVAPLAASAGVDGVVVGTALVEAAAAGPHAVRDLVRAIGPSLARPDSYAAPLCTSATVR